MSATATVYVLALATLGDVTKIETILSYVAPPKVAKASTVSCHCRWHYGACFANGNTALIPLANPFYLDEIFKQISFFSQGRLVVAETANDDLRRLAESGDHRRVFGAGAKSGFLTAAEKNRVDRGRARSVVQSSDARAIKLTMKCWEYYSKGQPYTASYGRKLRICVIS